ncbi:MAG: hypothetical protein V4481_01305 [Patescibacteria group bacterium]
MKTDKTLVTSERTLDGTTAGLVAAIANALSRKIGSERMKDLIADSDKLKHLLTPLIDDDALPTLPFMAKSQGYGSKHLSNTIWINPNISTGDMVPTMRNIMVEMYERKLAPHTEEDALRLCEVLMKCSWAQREIWAIPFLSRKKLKMFLHDKMGDKEAQSVVVKLDEANGQLLHIPLLLTTGWHDRSNCFQ